MKELTIEDVVKRLIGPVQPLGQSSVDEQRFQNLKTLCDLTNALVKEIDDVSYLNRNSRDHSVKKASEYAERFLRNEIGIQE